jgi:NADPH:quinone reductase-like Zn-dependent oxidoreductase
MRGGRLVTCGATAGTEAPTDLRYIFGRRLSIHGTWIGSKGELYDLMRAVEAGRLRPVVHQVFPWQEVVHAQDVMERSEHFGKLVLAVPGGSGAR